MLSIVRGMTLGGKLSLAYLCAATILLLTVGQFVPFIPLILGFPLILTLVVVDQVFQPGSEGADDMVVVFAIIWVLNAYIVGHVMAKLIKSEPSKNKDGL